MLRADRLGAADGTGVKKISTAHSAMKNLICQVTAVMAFLLSRALITFNKRWVQLHWYYDFAALAFNVLALTLYLTAISIEDNWHIINIGFTMCFALQVPLQLWAISVVRSCYDFFNLLYVLLKLAEK